MKSRRCADAPGSVSRPPPRAATSRDLTSDPFFGKRVVDEGRARADEHRAQALSRSLDFARHRDRFPRELHGFARIGCRLKRTREAREHARAEHALTRCKWPSAVCKRSTSAPLTTAGTISAPSASAARARRSGSPTDFRDLGSATTGRARILPHAGPRFPEKDERFGEIARRGPTLLEHRDRQIEQRRRHLRMHTPALPSRRPPWPPPRLRVAVTSPPAARR